MRAGDLLSTAVKREPQNPGFLHTLARFFERAGNSDAAAGAYRRSIEAAHGQHAAIVNLANLLTRMGEHEEAEHWLRAVLSVDTGHAEAWHNLGFLLRQMNRFADAEQALERALALMPSSVETLDLLSLALSDQGRYDEAERVCRRALSVDPRSTPSLNHLSLNRIAQGHCEDARTPLGDALRHAPADPVSHHNLSYLALCTGDYATGWPEYEWSFAAGVRTPDRHFEKPRWTGPGDPNDRVLAWREQGIGDEIMFANAFHDLIASTQRTLIECDARLVSLFARSFAAADVYPEGHTPDDSYDAQVPHGSLGLHFRRSAADYPDTPYLVCDEKMVRSWRDRLTGVGGKPKIGISWTSELLNNERQLWFSGLATWLKVLSRDDIDIVNLQYGDHEAELTEVEDDLGIRILRWDDLDLRDDIDSLAALCRALDGAVGASGAAMTLAAAVGTPIVQIRKAPEPVFYEHALVGADIVRKPWRMPWSDAVDEVDRRLTKLLARCR